MRLLRTGEFKEPKQFAADGKLWLRGDSTLGRTSAELAYMIEGLTIVAEWNGRI